MPGKTFDADELAEMYCDLARVPRSRKGLRIVAELHACSPKDVIRVLGLYAAVWDKPARKKPICPRRMAYTQAQLDDAVADVLRGRPLAKTAELHGVPYSTLAYRVRCAKWSHEEAEP